MKKTLLLCFIHGFKGDDGTFGELPPHLKALVSNALPQLNVVTAIYPQYETRGDLASCVARFRDWLQTRVIDIEVEAGTPSPMIDPSVRTILVAHSMGGIVAADTLLSILDDKTISSSNEAFMFPYIQGILAFDTPFIGLTPALFAHAADKNIKSASAALSTLASGIFASKAVDKKKEANATEGGGGWGSWGKVAAYAGVAAVLAGGAGAAYLKRDEIAQGAGWATNWISSHLEFVSALYKGEELRNRSNRASTVPGVGFANLHTSLGKPSAATSSATAVVTPERTFVVVPSLGSSLRKHWVKCINPKATDEVHAHVSMFTPAGNPGYYDMSNKARDLVVKWVNDGWDFSHGRFSPDMKTTAELEESVVGIGLRENTKGGKVATTETGAEIVVGM